MKIIFVAALLAVAVPAYSQLTMTGFGSFGGGGAPPAAPGGNCVNPLPTILACDDVQVMNPNPALF